MDQLSAHLDRGWNLAQKGDASGAAACARRALELDPESPEVHNLLGYSASLLGEGEEALEHYRQALTLDETYFEAMLNAAEILIHPLGEWDEAVQMCDDALDYAETKEETVDCLLLRVDALLGKGKLAEAKETMSRMPDPPFDKDAYVFQIGRTYFELGQYDKAAPYIEEAVRLDPTNSDAMYYLGMLRDEAGDSAAAVEAFLKSRAMDMSFASPEWAPSPDAFAQIVRRVIQGLDQLLGQWVHNANVYIVDVPGAELVVDGFDPRALVVLDARPEHHHDELHAHDDTDAHHECDHTALHARLFVYQRNVERAAGSVAAMETELAAAIEQEIMTVFLDHNAPAPEDKSQLN